MVTEPLGQITPLDDKGAPTRSWSGSTRSWPQRELAAFFLIPVLMLVAVATGTVIVSERIARTTALDEAERTAVRVAEVLVAPVIDEALDGVPGRWQELERILTTRMSDGSIASVVVWSAEGQIVFASERDLVGERISPSDELLAAIGGSVVADVDEAPETVYGGTGDGPMVEVYVPLTVRGEPMAVETYFNHDGIDRQAALLRGEIIPMAVGALVLLQVVQVPIAISLARRVRRHESERAELMELSLTASERERRAIAADVHDGPVQDLAGISYALGALRASVPADRQATVDRLVGAVRSAVQSLRRLMIDIYPPDLSGPGLCVAISDLVEPLRARGTVVSLEIDPPPDLSPEAAAVIYRTAKEALVNAASHAEAQRVWVCLEQTEHEGGAAVRLEVADDGVGFPETGTDRRRDGHVGLRVLVDRVVDLGGTVELGNRRNGGAVMTAVIPLHHSR
jgi:signal transduction histidine kinase